MSQPSPMPPRPLFDLGKRRLLSLRRYRLNSKAALIIGLVILVTLAATWFSNDAVLNSIVASIAHGGNPYASVKGTPNTANPMKGTRSVIHLPPPVKAKPFTPAKTQPTIQRPYTPAMKPLIMALDPARGLMRSVVMVRWR